MENPMEEAALHTPKRFKRDKEMKTPLGQRVMLSDDDEEDSSTAVTPIIPMEKSNRRSAKKLSNSVSNLSIDESENESEDEDFEEEEPVKDDDDKDEDYGEKPKKPKAPSSSRKKITGKRRVANAWTVSQTFPNDVAAMDYIETSTPWIKDKDKSTKNEVQIGFYCGLVTGKRCPAKAYLALPFEQGQPIQLYFNNKDHVHPPLGRGIPPAVKREIENILLDEEVTTIDQVLTLLESKQLPLPTKKQIQHFTNPKTKTPKVKLPPAPKRKQKEDMPEVSEATKKRKRPVVQHTSDEEE